MSQLAFKLTEIDREATKNAVENALETYRFLLLSQPDEILPNITQNYSFIPPSKTNERYSSTEQVALLNVQKDHYRQEYIKKIQLAINRLGYWERAVLIRRYMTQENVFDYQVYNELGLSERKYYRIKSSAFYKLAFALKIEVYARKKGEDK